MKIAICGDVHWSVYSSILRQRGNKYSLRLENLINSVNWVEQTAFQKGCGLIVYLGDFFDKPDLTAEELSALSEVRWSDISKYFIVGNHEMALQNLSISSAHLLNMNKDIYVITDPSNMRINDFTELCFLPYMLPEKLVSLGEFFPNRQVGGKRIVFSHNDMLGVQWGGFASTVGLSLDDIEQNCDYYFNGHLHNEGTFRNSKIVNVGNLTGQNFNEDGTQYKHKIIIFDTNTMTYEEVENPYAFNFYKIDATIGLPFDLKQNAVLSVKVDEAQFLDVQEFINTFNPTSVRYNIIPQVSKVDLEEVKQSLAINHLEEFEKFILEKFENKELVKEELMEVLK